MDKQDSIPINISNNEIHININENEIKDVTSQNNLLFPKNPSVSQDFDLSPEKVVKEKQGKPSEKIIKEKQGKPIQKDISVNEINSFSFQDVSIGNINNQENSTKEKEESLQRVVRVNLNDLYSNPPTMTDKRVINTQIPKSLEDWIENHSKKALEEPIVSPEKPPSYIPVLETTEDLDEIITPKRSVSCRARNHNTTIRQIKVMNPTQNINQTSNTLNNSASIKKHHVNKQSQLIHLTEHDYIQNHRSQNLSIDTESIRKAQKGIPKYQLCIYKQCDFIATDRCEKCYDPLCLNHLQRFYYTLPSFSGKNLCINCYKKASRSYVWVYLLSGFLSFIALIVILINKPIKDYLKSNNSGIWFYLCFFALSIMTVASFILAHLCSTLLTYKHSDNKKYIA